MKRVVFILLNKEKVLNYIPFYRKSSKQITINKEKGKSSKKITVLV